MKHQIQITITIDNSGLSSKEIVGAMRRILDNSTAHHAIVDGLSTMGDSEAEVVEMNVGPSTGCEGLTVPVVHNMGTGRRGLLELNREAYQALHEAEVKLRLAAPHGRDYYVHQEEGAFEQARAEHRSRQLRVSSVMEELTTLALKIQDQG